MRNAAVLPPTHPVLQQTLFTPAILIRAKFDPLFSCAHTLISFLSNLWKVNSKCLHIYAMRIHIITFRVQERLNWLEFWCVFFSRQNANTHAYLHAHPCLIACNNRCSRIFSSSLAWRISSARHIAIVFAVQFKSIHISKLIVRCTRHFLTVPIIFTRPQFCLTWHCVT